jgi:hypothetical protein
MSPTPPPLTSPPEELTWVYFPVRRSRIIVLNRGQISALLVQSARLYDPPTREEHADGSMSTIIVFEKRGSAGVNKSVAPFTQASKNWSSGDSKAAERAAATAGCVSNVGWKA